MVLTKELTLPLSDAHIKHLKETEQNPKYHAEGNVYNHTVLVLEQFYKYAEAHFLTEEELSVFYWAAVLHDIGKTKVTRWVGDRWTSRGHEKAGVSIARDILLARPELTPSIRSRILDLVRWHHVPLRWGLRNEDLSSYKLLATRTDLRMLGMFSMFDILGRECIRKPEVLEIIQQFNKVIVPASEESLGSFLQIQEAFQNSGRKKKNALWAAICHKEVTLLEKILNMTPPNSEESDTSCILTIGPPRSGKTAYVQERFPTHHHIDLRKHQALVGDLSQSNSLKKDLGALISKHLNKESNVVLDGSNLLPENRQKFGKLIRGHHANVHYLFFERSLDHIKALNKSHSLPMDENMLTEAHSQLDWPHPWESHRVEIV